ncbi:magnesium/cobalt transporter CorA [Rubrivirga marina]|nr:magnesium/cobalt transporter CorA [Rubrivirga marina]
MLVYEGDEGAGPVQIHVIDYDADRLEEGPATVDACDRYRDARTVSWIDVDGVHDVALVERLGASFGLHPLTLEDIVSPDQRPKLEEYPGYVYVVLQMMHYDHDARRIEAEQVSLVVGEGFVLSFQESKEGDVFEPVRQRLREGRGVIRKHGADFLTYALIDVVVDHYMEILEGLGEHIEDVEDDLTARPNADRLRDITGLRRQVIALRRSIWPLRDVVAALERADHPFVTDAIDPYLRDVYDHTVRTIELIESAREILASLVELHLSAVSNRLTEVMKVLTIISVFFLPLTFIAGVYGMNFNPEASPLNMPELNWFYGYPFAWGLMLAVALVMFGVFRRKGWL